MLLLKYTHFLSIYILIYIEYHPFRITPLKINLYQKITHVKDVLRENVGIRLRINVYHVL